MNSDVYFSIGTSHKVCEDYAISNKRDNKRQIIGKPFAILSDGCSGADDTDFGSRLVARAAQQCIGKSDNTEALIYGTMHTSLTYCRSLGLDYDSLCATLLIATYEESEDNGFFKVLRIGDGAIVGILDDGTFEIHLMKFVSGAPYYLRYEAEEDVKENWVNRFGTDIIRTTITLAPDGTKLEQDDCCATLNLSEPYDEMVFPASKYKAIAVLSDGAEAFEKVTIKGSYRSTEQVDPIMIISELSGFCGKNQFVHRNCNKALSKFAADSITPFDDISIGMICA